MRIIISPAKQMKSNSESMAGNSLPVFIRKAEEILSWMKNLSYEDAKTLWACSDKIAELNYDRLKDMSSADLRNATTPAILAYDGIAFKYMGPDVFTYDQFDYVEEHLRILSGFYGVVRPMDSVVNYRLEMQAKAKVAGTGSLYEYWGSQIYENVIGNDRTIINLASKEYSKCIEKYLQDGDRFITCVFGELQETPKGTKVVQKGVYAKMARGEIVRYMAENQIEEPEDMKTFDSLGYEFRQELSDECTYTFRRNEVK